MMQPPCKCVRIDARPPDYMTCCRLYVRSPEGPLHDGDGAVDHAAVGAATPPPKAAAPGHQATTGPRSPSSGGHWGPAAVAAPARGSSVHTLWPSRVQKLVESMLHV